MAPSTTSLADTFYVTNLFKVCQTGKQGRVDFYTTLYYFALYCTKQTVLQGHESSAYAGGALKIQNIYPGIFDPCLTYPYRLQCVDPG